jgi:hypothetical protein
MPARTSIEISVQNNSITRLACAQMIQRFVHPTHRKMLDFRRDMWRAAKSSIVSMAAREPVGDPEMSSWRNSSCRNVLFESSCMFVTP